MAFTTKREELAWAAGLFDGEGHVGSGTHRPDIYLSVSQVDRRVLDRFCSAVALGAVYGPYDHPVIQRRGNEQPRFYFQTQRFETVQAIVAMLWTWLSPVKRDQARITLQRRRHDGLGQRRAKYWLSCKRGHPRTPENVKVYSFHGYECRRCLVCESEQRQRRDLVRKTAVAMLAA